MPNLNKLQALRASCSRIVYAKDLLNDEAVLDDLIAKAFYQKRSAAKIPYFS